MNQRLHSIRTSFPPFDSFDRFFDAGPRTNPDFRLVRDGDTLHLEVDLPGYDKDHLNVQSASRQLKIIGSVKNQAFELKFQISPELDLTAISAQFKDGVLRVILPKSENSDQTRSITIN